MAIKTASEINREIVAAMHNHRGGYKSADPLDIIYQWGLSIIDECADSAVDWDQSDVTIDRTSILKLKEQL